MRRQVKIDWKSSGKPDGFFGTGATFAERALAVGFGLAATAMLFWLWLLDSNWTWAQYALAAALTLDATGGAVANALNSAKRFYHSPPQAEEGAAAAFFKNHFAFTLLHVHPLIIGFAFGEGGWTYGLFWYLALALSAILILNAPLYLRRPLAAGIVLLAILINAYLIPPVSGFEWFAPVLFLKIVAGHLVREEPYRP